MAQFSPEYSLWRSGLFGVILLCHSGEKYKSLTAEKLGESTIAILCNRLLCNYIKEIKNMKRTMIESPVIMKLKEKIELGNNEAVQVFWNNIEKANAPLIEKIDGDLENSLVTFVYKGNEDIENIVLIPPIGRDNLLENKMEKFLDTNIWYASYEINNKLRFKYSFSVNDSFDINCEKRWDNLECDKLNKNKLVFKDENEEDDEVDSYVVMPNAGEEFWVKERNDIHKGIIHEHKFYSENVERARRVIIYTPYGYNEDDKPYKFLVLTDAEEYINVLSARNVIDNLITDKKIEPIVVIFIGSIGMRSKELSCDDTFVEMIVNELLPWIRNNYNISSQAYEAIIGGLSLGGLTASYLGLKHSEVFGNVLSQSGAYWYKPKDYDGYEPDCWISTKFKAIDKLPLKFYLNVGVLEHKEGMIGTNNILKDVLIGKGYDVYFEYFNSGHDYLSWGETLANGLISLIGINKNMTKVKDF